MKGILGIAVALVLLSSFVLADMSVSSVKAYSRYGSLITRPYLIEYDRVVAEVATDGPKCNMVMAVTPGAGLVGCQYLSSTHYRCTYTVFDGYGKGMSQFSISAKNCPADGVEQTGTIFEAYLNPGPYVPALSEPVVFPLLVPGTIVYSNPVTVSIQPEGGADGKIYVSILNKIYTSTPGRCPYSNRYPYTSIEYSIDGVVWKKISTTPQLVGLNSASIRFRTKVPSVCIGAYDIAKNIVFKAEVVK